jgi:hypothetical protein
MGHMSSRMDSSRCSTTGRVESQSCQGLSHVSHGYPGRRFYRSIGGVKRAAGRSMRMEREASLLVHAVKKGFGTDSDPAAEDKDLKKKGRPKKNTPGAKKGFGTADTLPDEKKKIRVKKSNQKVRYAALYISRQVRTSQVRGRSEYC